MMSFMGTAPSVSSAIFVCNLPPGTSEVLLADHFGQIGLVMKDRTSGAPMIWLCRDKSTQELNGDATIFFEDPHAALAAVEWLNNTELNGNIISVSVTEAMQYLNLVATSPTIGNPIMNCVSEQWADSGFAGDAGGYYGAEFGGTFGGAGGPVDLEGGIRRGRVDCKPWQQEGDWPCPNSSCVNINFAFRGVCNRCGSARPAGNMASGGGLAGGSRGRSRGASDAGARGGRGPCGPPGLFGPNDWNCPMCGNINWAKRLKCNICNTSKPGYNEGGAREGRAGGFKEFDEAEIQETKRRRREQEEDDGEMYDEFGNLKKKFRSKVKLGDSLSSPGHGFRVGKAGWDKDLGVKDGHTKETDREGYSCSSDRYENERRDALDLERRRLDHRGYHHKARGCKEF